MVNRPAGGARSKKHLRAPLDWYLEPTRSPEQLFHGVDFTLEGRALPIWDGCCGRGTILEVAHRYGHRVYGSDLRDRRGRYGDFDFPGFPFTQQDILETTANPFGFARDFGPQWAYVSNPPYNYSEGIAERIIRHVLTDLRPWRAAFLVPIAFLASNGRFKLFTRDFRPSHTCVHSDRITCPPGHKLDELANPFDGGMADYVWLIFTRPHRWRTETVWLEPGPHPYPPRRATRGEANAA
jgi:hypothetical protein